MSAWGSFPLRSTDPWVNLCFRSSTLLVTQFPVFCSMKLLSLVFAELESDLHNERISQVYDANLCCYCCAVLLNLVS
jgi:hypothetical protein